MRNAIRPADADDHARQWQWAGLASAFAVLLLCLVVGLPTIRADNYFLGDDFGLVQHLHKVPLARFLSYFGSDWTEGIYGFKLDELRPFLGFSYYLDSHVFGAANASGYHVTNVILHMLNGLLVLAIARSAAPGKTAFPLLAASLFVLMPSHAEPISWISGRVDSIAALFTFSAFLCFVQFRLRQRGIWVFPALLLFVCGLFAKQSLIVFPFLILAYDVFYGPRLTSSTLRFRALISRYGIHLPFFLLMAMYLGLRHSLFGNAVREDVLTLATIQEFVLRQYFYLTKLLPFGSDASFAAKAILGFIAILTFSICGIWLLVRRAAHGPAIRRLLFFGPVWYAITIAPMVVTYPSARHLYVTSAGISIALASLMLPGRPHERSRGNTVRLLASGILVALYCVALRSNISTWITNGVESNRFAKALPPMLQSLPQGSTVLIGIPNISHEEWMWAFGLPFALQAPFAPDDLYSRYAIVESPQVYCCLTKQWLAAKQTALTSLLSPGAHEVTYISSSPQTPGL